MRINYDYKKDYIKKYNEANGAIYMLKRLQKNNNLKVKNYMSYILSNCLWVFMLGLLIDMIATFTTFTILSQIGELLMYAGIGFYLFFWVWIYICSKMEINSKVGSILINETGITDENENGNKMFFSYNNLKMIIVTKNLIVFAFNNPIMIFVPNNEKSKVIEEIKKYSNVAIIDNN